ncbi:PEGA domain-containing protein [Silvibacterium dinghuense]|uniref:PEGA domain-containing protein n=1 Tax=Silvibacterium dinghuense TaxID=1560006 RepID=UPI001E4A2E7D|nr:PEGA domain-containing protein [Silvibacterium dinghuense]
MRKFVSVFSCISLLSASTYLIAQDKSTSSVKPVQESSSPNAQPQQPPKPNTLLDGTPIKLKLGRTLSSADAKVGDEVDFEVVEEIRVDGQVVIPKGGLALATVTEAEHKKSMGRAGKLNVNIDSARLVDGEKATLRATEGGKGGGHVGAMTGAIVATSIVFFPAAPLFLFIHGKDITIPKGTEITAYVDGDMVLDMAKLNPSAVPVAVAQAVTSQLAVDANVPNCDIEVDGAFVGNTPSQISIAYGKHEIAVKKTGYESWSKTMMIAGPNIHLQAQLNAVGSLAAQGATEDSKKQQ